MKKTISLALMIACLAGLSSQAMACQDGDDYAEDTYVGDVKNLEKIEGKRLTCQEAEVTMSNLKLIAVREQCLGYQEINAVLRGGKKGEIIRPLDISDVRDNKDGKFTLVSVSGREFICSVRK